MMVLTRVYISLHSALAWRMHDDDWCDSLPFVARLFKSPPNLAFACIHFVCEENQIVCEEKHRLFVSQSVLISHVYQP